MTTDSESLFRRCAAHDPEAWGEFVRQYERIVRAACQWAWPGARREQVDDGVQSVYECLLRNGGSALRRYDGSRGAPEAFIWIVAHNVAVSAYRHAGHEQGASEDTPLPKTSPDPAADELTIFVRKRISALPEGKRRALQGALAGRTCRELAKIEGCTPGAIRLRIHRAKQILARDPAMRRVAAEIFA